MFLIQCDSSEVDIIHSNFLTNLGNVENLDITEPASDDLHR